MIYESQHGSFSLYLSIALSLCLTAQHIPISYIR